MLPSIERLLLVVVRIFGLGFGIHSWGGVWDTFMGLGLGGLYKQGFRVRITYRDSGFGLGYKQRVGGHTRVRVGLY